MLQVAAHQAKILITDTGVGIEAGKLPHIFERFYQVDDSTTRMHEGSGIGLALVKELTDLLQGSVLVKSLVGRGTTVELCLPFQPIEPVVVVEFLFRFPKGLWKMNLSTRSMLFTGQKKMRARHWC